MFEFHRVKKAAIRLLLATASVVAAVQCFRLLLLPAVQHVFEPGDSVTSGVRRAGILAFALLGYWAYVRFVEKRPATELRPAPMPIAAGLASGALLALLAMGLLFAMGAYVMTSYQGFQTGLWGVAGLIAVAAILEEIVFRGILFRILESAWGTMPALWIQSTVFALLHIANAQGQATTFELVTTVVSGVLLGGLWTLVFVISRSLWVAAANHAAWNFTIVLAGLPLSGLENWRALAVLESEYNGPNWLTGGVFGPEDSLVTMALVATSLALLIRWARLKRHLVHA